MEQLEVFILELIRNIFPAQYWNWNYFVGLWEKYASISGFFMGAAVFLFLYFASDENEKWKSFIRVFAIVALINAVDSINTIAVNFINNSIFHTQTSIHEAAISGAFNPISIMILILVISEAQYFRTKGGTFSFGISTFAVSGLLLGINFINEYLFVFFVVRVIIAAVICHICNKIPYAFISYISFSIYFIVTQALESYIWNFYGFSNFSDAEIIFEEFKLILASYKAEYIIILFITIVFAIFEIFVLSETKFSIKILGLEKLLLVAVISIASVVAVVALGLKFEFDRFVPYMTDTEETWSSQVVDYEEIGVNWAESSSNLVSSRGNVYDINYTMDGSLDTCWQDGVDGNGADETLTYGFDSDVLLGKIEIANGNRETSDKYEENCRICSADIHFYLYGEEVFVTTMNFEDSYDTEYTELILEEPIQCDQVMICITSVYEGSQYNDLCVAEVRFQEAILEE